MGITKIGPSLSTCISHQPYKIIQTLEMQTSNSEHELIHSLVASFQSSTSFGPECTLMYIYTNPTKQPAFGVCEMHPSSYHKEKWQHWQVAAQEEKYLPTGEQSLIPH